MSLLDFRPRSRRTSDVSSAIQQHIEPTNKQYVEDFNKCYAANASASQRLEDTIRELLALKGSIP
jgi:hypothetical protein